MTKKLVLASFLIVSVFLFLLNSPLVNATSGSKTWGTPMIATQYIVIGGNTEIPAGQYAYVFNKQTSEAVYVDASEWQNLVSGDMSSLKNQIESQIPGSQVVWLKISWDDAQAQFFYPGNYWEYIVKGFYVEALVKNNQAGLTGLEIVAIIMVIAFLVAVVTLCITGAWVVWEVMSAAAKLGPAFTVAIGLIILIMILVALVVIFAIAFGGGLSAKGKKRSVSIGKKQ